MHLEKVGRDELVRHKVAAFLKIAKGKGLLLLRIGILKNLLNIKLVNGRLEGGKKSQRGSNKEQEAYLGLAIEKADPRQVNVDDDVARLARRAASDELARVALALEERLPIVILDAGHINRLKVHAGRLIALGVKWAESQQKIAKKREKKSLKRKETHFASSNGQVLHRSRAAGRLLVAAILAVAHG